MENIFKKLVIFELANNHMGDLKHGLKIIKKFSTLKNKYKNFKFGFKLQFRDLKTFIHPDMQNNNDLHYIKRFNETKLSLNDIKILLEEIKRKKFISICTPFDENSVDLIERLNIEIIKVASCSFNDWPLLEKIVEKNKPIIASTGGASENEIDNVVTFFKNRNKKFALMHCVAEYPTPNNKLNLNRIRYLKEKYKKIEIGYSTHEHPNQTQNIKIALAMGANLFEKHIGLETNKYTLNKYSANINQTDEWLKNAEEAFKICGDNKKIFYYNKKEDEGLNSLKRAVFAKRNIKKGSFISDKDYYLAFPAEEKQLLATHCSKYSNFIAKKNIKKNQYIKTSDVKIINTRKLLNSIINEIDINLKKLDFSFSGNVEYEISHHYGIKNFKKFGLVLFNIINGIYCKKILYLFPKQIHPEQYHLQKTETFHVIKGDVEIKLDGKRKILYKGDILTINPKTKHEFTSKKGAIIEEISTTHYKNDSFYTDPKINKNKNRKTLINKYWE